MCCRGACSAAAGAQHAGAECEVVPSPPPQQLAPHLERNVGAEDLLQQAGQLEAGNVKGALMLEGRRAAANGD